MPHISTTAKQTPEKPAFIMASSGEVVTYRQLDERSNQGAQLFRSLGLETGDHIGLMLENCRQFLEIAAAATRSGIVYTPISTHLKTEETRYILQNCGARLFITSAKLAEVAEDIAGRVDGIEHYFMVNGASPGFESWDDAISTLTTEPIADQSIGVPMLYSSGTTGQPKGVYRAPVTNSLDEMHPNLKAFAQVFGFDEHSVYLSPAPLYHAAPLSFTLLNLMVGGTAIIMERFDAEHALQLIGQYRATHSQWVPIMFIRMLKLPQSVREQYDISGLKQAIHAAAPCPIEIKQQMIDWWGPIIVEYYSASEGIGITVIDSSNWLTHRGSVGPSLVGILHILDDDGNELPAGEVGTVYFEGGSDFEYFGEAEKTANAYNDKGWSTLGDVGYLDEDNFLYLTDRKNFMISSGGLDENDVIKELGADASKRLAQVALALRES